MPAAELPLQDLAQRLAEKQAELEAARRAYDARFADITRQREQLQAQLRAVDAEIQAVNSTAAPGAAPAAAPSAPAAAPEPRAPQAQAKGTTSLPQFLLELVRSAGRPLTVKELTDEVVRAKLPTSSANLPKMVSN